MNPEPAYHLKEIRHFYGTKKVLDIPDLVIEKGSITGILGPNGSGKSTLLKLMAFIRKPSFGQVIYNGRAEHPFSETVRSKVTLLTQKPYLLKRSVYDNIVYGLKIRKDRQDLDARVTKALATVGLANDFIHRKWHELSGGEAQRVALAARLILNPDVLLLDEPIASVDTESAKLIREASLNARKQMGTTLVVVSHDIQWLYSISDRQLSIYKGTMFATGMENVISGPFEPAQDHRVVKQVRDGQQIFLKAPESGSTTAIIRKKDIGIDLTPQAPHSGLNQIKGGISAMMLEKKTGFVLATITCDDLSFTLRLTQDQIQQMGLAPGRQVVIKFMSGDVAWI